MVFFIKQEESKYADIKYPYAIGLYLINSVQYFLIICLIQRVLVKFSISTASGHKGSTLAALFIGLSNVICSFCSSNIAYYLEKTKKVGNHDFVSVPININKLEMIIMFFVSILIYKFILWEKFFRVLSSNLMSPGAFSHECARILANGNSYASSNVRKLINIFGNKYGCHTCGWKSEDYVADHIPPNTVAKNNIIAGVQYLYPQCTVKLSKVLIENPILFIIEFSDDAIFISHHLLFLHPLYENI
ncbi:hypothetical protein HZS_880 [Henneguya salminicola]|nr:hypothetical protein HZS_880 [Henneguya salminicola]